ncbi:hypothetical protein SAMN02745121_02444 [Nannocystis exedens]|uniref:Uncharacterized protein n=1 Tax=Nannocystis exedens TaxID=54 RepID=A0A1I1WJZ9_9BACT|nr:hypothetical protein [Nannocystis exedens]PCC67808.1 hypothetical protein NAEX_00816 [Nannocystis exedens]SFD95544.1 hypothetical protein SAMN02745121_02444 [Nannocystis exedens]
MPTRRSPFILPLVLFACTDRPLGDTDGSTAGPSTSDSPPATGTNTDAPGTATVPTTGTPQPTTATTVDPSATTAIDPSATTAIDPSDTTLDPGGTTTFDPQPKLDFFLPGPNHGLSGCTLEAPAGTMVSGSSSLGPFAAQRAWFGYVGFDEEPFTPVLMFVSPAADPATELQDKNGSSGPILFADVSTDPFLEGSWVGTWPMSANVFAQGMLGELARPDAVVIDDLAGNWSSFDPADPPRLVGSLQGGIAGPFDAVFCDKLNVFIIPE